MNNDKYTISAIIPAYNIEKYIATAIESVLAQTSPADEIIVVDDGSTDNTASIIKQYPQVKYIYQENAGLSAARNTAIKNATGQWIALLDGDDYWLENKLEKQLEVLKQNPQLMWVTCNYQIHETEAGFIKNAYSEQTINKFNNNKSWFNYLDGFQNNVPTAPSTMIFNRKIFDQIGDFDQELRYAEDIDMYFRTALHWNQLGFSPEPLIVYFQARQGSLTHSTPAEKILQNLNIIFSKMVALASPDQIPILKKCILMKIYTWVYINYSQGNFNIIRETLGELDKILEPKYINFMARCIKLPKFCRGIIQKILRKKGYGIQQ